MRAATVVHQLRKSCRTYFVFYCMFYFTCDRSLNQSSPADPRSIIAQCGEETGLFRAQILVDPHCSTGGLVLMYGSL